MPTNDSRSLTRVTKAAVVSRVIDITPEPAAKSRQASVSQIFASLCRQKTTGIGVAVIAFALVIYLLARPHWTRVPRMVSAPAQTAPVAAKNAEISQKMVPKPVAAPAQPVLVELNLPTAIQQGLVQCLWRGNGKDRLVMDARNLSGQTLRLHLPAGQLLASADSTVVILKSQTLDFHPKGELHDEFATVATSAANKVTGAEFHLSAGALPDLDKLFTYAAANPATTPGAIQTATLILTENLPLSAFARFNELSAGAQQVQESQDFKADTCDVLSALTIIKALGIDRPLAVTIDPQLEIEAMIDPASHAMAVSYYGIADEWAYWKGQLLQGDPSTRHYALYGIARFYPDIALQMLPKWARQESMSPVYRMSAVEALAQTHRAEAIPVLRELEREFGGTSDLGHAAHQGANFLDAQFAPAAKDPATASHHGVLASVGN